MSIATGQDTLDTVFKKAKIHIGFGDRDNKSSDNHYTTAGTLLIDARERVRKTRGITWEQYLSKYDIKRQRASEVMRIAKGETTPAALRERSKTSMAASRAKRPQRCGQSEEIPERKQTAERRNLDSRIDALSPAQHQELLRFLDELESRRGLAVAAKNRTVDKDNKPKAVRDKEKAKLARNKREEKVRAAAIDECVEGWIAAGKLTDQEITDYREHGIMPAWHATSACGIPLYNFIPGVGVVAA
jgi:hypothetical protein